MAPPLWLDFSEARPEPAEIKAAGYVGVIRYLCYLPNPKVIDQTEDASYEAVGLDRRLVWEWYAGRALEGAAAGAADGAEAGRQAAALGYSKAKPIYFAVDEDTPASAWPLVSGYIRAAQAAARGYRCAIYGEDGLLAWLVANRAIDASWQAGASTSWEGNAELDSKANFYQRESPTTAWAVALNGAVDEDVQLNDDTTTVVVASPAVTPPASPPTPTPEDSMFVAEQAGVGFFLITSSGKVPVPSAADVAGLLAVFKQPAATILSPHMLSLIPTLVPNEPTAPAAGTS